MSRLVGQDVAIRYPGGAVYIGHLKEATPVDLVLENPVWVADTGRLSLFFKGDYDNHCEWETMGAFIEIPRAHAEISPWTNGVPDKSR